jgi:hypothetical protein
MMARWQPPDIPFLDIRNTPSRIVIPGGMPEHSEVFILARSSQMRERIDVPSDESTFPWL